MGRLIDDDEVKKRFPIMENDFGMVINERLHKEIDKIPTVEAIPKDRYEARLKADLVAMLTELQLEIEEAYCEVENDYDRGRNYGLFMTTEIIQQKINALKENIDGTISD